MFTRMPTFNDLPPHQRPNFFPPYTLSANETQEVGTSTLNVALETYCRALSEYSDGTRGENLRGDPAAHTIDAVFRQQSVPWTNIAENFGDKCHRDTYDFLAAALKHVAGEHVAEALQREYVRQHRADKNKLLQERIKELLWPFKEIRLKTYNPRYMREANSLMVVSDEDADTFWSYAKIAQANRLDEHLKAAAVLLDKAEILSEVSTISRRSLLHCVNLLERQRGEAYSGADCNGQIRGRNGNFGY